MGDPSSYDDLIEELSVLIGQAREGLEASMLLLQDEADNIIIQKCRDISQIEHLLDNVSSLLYASIGHQLYLRLLEYYKPIDSEGANFYWNLYEEINA
jgi:hypothetical protein